ncbi:MAG: von Willebrand factor type A domain-containing protein [candidate division Zixibacteria bacterium]|nr:von Willebrand factor type A domain-containing protein [candidate division Zixibacteria bacterium]
MRTTTILRWTVFSGIGLVLLVAAYAGNVGRIVGTVTDAKSGEPIIGASIQIEGTLFGASTDFEGEYQINRLEPGVYTLKVSSVGYNQVRIEKVTVAVDSTSRVDVKMSEATTELGEVINVIGVRPTLDKTGALNEVCISQEVITLKPVQSVDALLEQVSGVQTNASGEVFVRGGRAGEVAYIIDGVPIADPLGGSGAVGGSLETGRPVGQGNAGNTQCPSVNPYPHGGNKTVNNVPYSAMFFEHHGVNPFVDTEDDSLSTFAADVDDGSYTVVRKYLNDCNLPPEAAVRVEEFVNHFDYGYDKPTTNAFSITVDGAPSPFGFANMRLLRIGIQGREIRPEQRRAANLVFVVDVSGSMRGGNRLGSVKSALRMLVEQLTADDRVAIVTFENVSATRLAPTSIKRRDLILSAIDGLHAGGSTNLNAGIKRGYELAAESFDRNKINRVILCSDGVANNGLTDPDGIVKYIRSHAEKGITLSSIGFGMGNYNDVMLEKLGNKGDGYYAYVDDDEEARRIFVDNLTGTLEVIARDVKLQVAFDPRVVRSYRLLGYENRDVPDEKFRDDKEDGGELGSGHRVTALYEIKLHEPATEAAFGEVFIRYKAPRTNEVHEVSRVISPDLLVSDLDQASTGLRLAAAAAEFAEVLRGSYWARDRDLNDVLRVASYVYVETEAPEVLELMGLISRADRYRSQLAQK